MEIVGLFVRFIITVFVVCAGNFIYEKFKVLNGTDDVEKHKRSTRKRNTGKDEKQDF